MRFQRRPHNKNQERYQRDDIKHEIPEYDGKSQGDEFIDWLITIERVFDYKEYSDEKNVKLVAINLRGYASLWWENLKREQEHIQANCPNKKAFTTLEGAIDEEDYHEEQHDDNLEEVVEHGDYGKYLMIQRVLHSDSSKEEPWLRHNISHTCCTSKGKVCTLIIDLGSCTNVVCEEMVIKLGFETDQFQKPYRMRWLDEGRNVQVNKRCLIPFSIGKMYQDKV
ncbi:uncharacterized protein [Nicotiana tomentosiformis]|uniref:uncharacterized protein n=1 Tax=Nicotiana tomentosiformis TaxID=4098 RepID=UPI00388C92D2